MRQIVISESDFEEIFELFMDEWKYDHRRPEETSDDFEDTDRQRLLRRFRGTLDSLKARLRDA